MVPFKSPIHLFKILKLPLLLMETKSEFQIDECHLLVGHLCAMLGGNGC